MGRLANTAPANWDEQPLFYNLKANKLEQMCTKDQIWSNLCVGFGRANQAECSVGHLEQLSEEGWFLSTVYVSSDRIGLQPT